MLISQKHVRKNAKPKRLTALKEIKELQTSTDLLIPKAPFRRLVREIVQQHKPDARISETACEALQESTEMYVTGLFEDTVLFTAHRNRVTVQPSDLNLSQYIRYGARPFEVTDEFEQDDVDQKN